MSGDDQAPARVLLSNFGSFGDVIPFLQMGKALHERGHEVTFATTANLRPQVEAAGLIFRSIGTAKRMDALHAEPGLWDPKRGLELMYDLAVELTEPSRQIVERERAQSAAEGRSFVAVGGMLSFGLRLARDCHPFPLMTVYLSPFLMRSRHRPPVCRGSICPPGSPGPSPMAYSAWWNAGSSIPSACPPSMPSASATVCRGSTTFPTGCPPPTGCACWRPRGSHRPSPTGRHRPRKQPFPAPVPRILRGR